MRRKLTYDRVKSYFGECWNDTDTIAYALIGAGLFFRILNVWLHNPMDSLWSDPARHWQYGTDPFSKTPMAAIDPILYQLWLGVVAKISQGEPLRVFVLTALLSVSAPLTWYLFLREYLASGSRALWGCAVIAWLPSWVGIYSYFMQETLLLPLLGLSLYYTCRATKKNTLGNFLLAGFFWALAGLTRAVAAPLAAVSMLFLWPGNQRRLLAAGLLALLVAALLLPGIYRRYEVLNVIYPVGYGKLNQIYALSNNKRIELQYYQEGRPTHWYWFESPSMNDRPFEPLSDWSSSREGLVRVGVHQEKGADGWLSEERPLTADDRFTILKENLIFLMWGKSWPDWDLERTWERAAVWTRWVWAPLAVFALALAVRRLFRDRRLGWLELLLLVWFITQGLLPVAINEGRYRKPFEGLLIAYCLTAGRREGLASPGGGGLPDSDDTTRIKT